MKPLYKNILLVVILVAVVGSIVYLEAIKPHEGHSITAQQSALNATSSSADNASGTDQLGMDGATTTPASASTGDSAGSSLTPAQFLASRASIVAAEAKQYQAAPEITDPSGFINTQPFTLGSLIGKKVVLLDFWTYSCINCLRTIPYVNAWYAKYKNAGLVVVGMHTPEFDFEHEYNNVQMAVKSLNIQYPVVLDNNMGTWNAYQNLYWPHEYLINIDGFITHDNVGEGNYNETESAIQAALVQRAEALGIPTSTVPTGFVDPSNAISINYSGVETAETYFGAERNEYLANGPSMTNGVYPLTIPSSTLAAASSPTAPASTAAAPGFYLGGTWDFEDQYAQNKTANAEILYQYTAKNLYMVAASASAKPITAKVLVDGQPITAAMSGSDVVNGILTIQANRLYNVIAGSNYDTHTIELMIQQPGLQAYTFTFG